MNWFQQSKTFDAVINKRQTREIVCQQPPHCYTRTLSAVNCSSQEAENPASSTRLGSEEPSEQLTESASLSNSFSSCQITSIFSQDAVKGGRAKEHAFQLARTGTPSWSHTPPRRPCGW